MAVDPTDDSSEGANNSEAPNQEVQTIRFVEFLQSVPPNQMRTVPDLVVQNRLNHGGIEVVLATPDIRLFCEHKDCGGERTFRFSAGSKTFYDKNRLDTFIDYTCSNCGSTKKKFCIHAYRTSKENDGSCYKYGELPHFGPPTPSKLTRLLGSDKDLFLQGRRCESLGLGIGAYTYYRRVVENRKNEIITEILRVADAVSSSEEIKSKLNAAKKEISFSKAVEEIKDAIPQTLLINGHNPLTLLHSALSKGVHEHSDEKCLELAHVVRIVLVELAEKVSAAIKDEAELKKALGRLMNASSNPNGAKAPKKPTG